MQRTLARMTSQAAQAQASITSWASKASNPTFLGNIDLARRVLLAAADLNTLPQDGNFNRLPSQFKSSIGDAAFPAESGRYHLYGSYAFLPPQPRSQAHRLMDG